MTAWPFSPYARPVGSFQLPVPPPVPSGGLCDQLTVDFPSEWLPYILGALTQLTLQSTWQGDDAAIADAQSRAWAIIGTIGRASCVVEPPSDGEEVEEMSNIRIDCDCRVFVKCCDGSEVELLTSKNPGRVQPASPSAGNPTPTGGGGKSSVCGVMQANGTYTLPWPVNTGDVLTFSELFGSTHDDRYSFYYCPDGYLYVAGTCFGTIARGGTEPMPSVLYASIVADIGGTFMNVLNLDLLGNPQPFTIPSGVTNAQVVLQLNTDSLPNMSGDVSFCVQLTNNQPISWSHTFDLTVAPGGWLPIPYAPAPSLGPVWTSGTGFVGDEVVSSGTDDTLDSIQFAWATATNITSVQVAHSSTGDRGDNMGLRAVYYNGSGYALGTLYGNLTFSAGSFDEQIGGLITGVTSLQIYNDRSDHSSFADGIISKLIITGNGFDPWA